MKTCRRCGAEKPLEQFCRDSRASDGRRARCHQCAAEYQAAWYRDRNSGSKEGQKKRKQERANERYAKLAVLKDVPCADCGGRFPRVCMDFDHVRGEKMDAISVMVRRERFWGTILAEVAKCDVVCANCHRVRTATRGQWFSEGAV